MIDSHEPKRRRVIEGDFSQVKRYVQSDEIVIETVIIEYMRR